MKRTSDERTASDERSVKIQRALLECAETGERIVIGDVPRFVGRDDMNNLCVDDPKVTKVHCGLTGTNHGVLLSDRSKNGTLIIGGEVLITGQYVLLRRDATIRVGDTVLKFSMRGPAEQSLARTFGPLESVTMEMQRIFVHLREQVDKPAPIHLTGEAGTGKRHLAETLHQASKRAGKPFVVVDCKTIPHDQLDAELFGHEAGAFPGAKKKESVFAVADGGTVFINEVERLSLEAQVRLLRVVEEKEVRSWGQARARKVDVRIVTGNRQDLARLVNEDVFHADVYARLCQVRFQLPLLRERRHDIELLTRQILTTLGQPKAFGALSTDTLDWMKKHDWRGNIQQLRDVLSGAVDLWMRAAQSGRLDVETAFAVHREFDHVRSEAARQDLVSQALTRHGTKLRDVHREATRLVYEMLARETGGNIAAMARRAGVSRHHVYKHYFNKQSDAATESPPASSDRVRRAKAASKVRSAPANPKKTRRA